MDVSNIERWSPFEELDRIRQNLLSSDWFGSMATRQWGPAIDVKETANEIVVHAEVPGIDPDDLEVIVEEDGLVLRGEVRREASDSQEGYHRVERRYGRFHRTIPFPVSVKQEEAVADYRDGILEIKIPKAESTSGARRLKINRSDNSRLQ